MPERPDDGNTGQSPFPTLSPSPTFPMPIVEPLVNTNNRSTPTGNLCWLVSEHSLIFASYAVSVRDLSDLVADYRKLFESVKQELPLTLVELPEGVAPFAERFLADTEKASELLSKYQNQPLAFLKLVSYQFPFDDYPGVKAFEAAAGKAACALGPGPP